MSRLISWGRFLLILRETYQSILPQIYVYSCYWGSLQLSEKVRGWESALFLYSRVNCCPVSCCSKGRSWRILRSCSQAGARLYQCDISSDMDFVWDCCGEKEEQSLEANLLFASWFMFKPSTELCVQGNKIVDTRRLFFTGCLGSPWGIGWGKWTCWPFILKDSSSAGPLMWKLIDFKPLIKS